MAKHRVILFSIWLLLLSPVSAKQAIYEVNWEEKPGADYYLVFFTTENNGSYMVKTRTNVLLSVDEITEISVRAHRDDHTVVGEKETPNVVKIDRRSEFDKLSDEDKVQFIAVEALEKEEKQAFEVKPWRLIGVGLKVGAENLDTKGGSSRFEGTDTVMETSFNLFFNPELIDPEARWSYLTWLDYHNFDIVKEEKFGSLPSTTETTELTRMHIGFNAFYCFYEFNDVHFHGLGGLEYMTISTMTREQSSSSNRDLETKSAIFPNIGLRTETEFTPGISGLVDIALIPVSFTKPKMTGYTLKFQILQDLLDQIKLSYHLNWQSYTLKYSVSCANATVTCSEDGQTDDIFIGLGAAFNYLF